MTNQHSVDCPYIMPLSGHELIIALIASGFRSYWIIEWEEMHFVEAPFHLYHTYIESQAHILES
jgi:hypothetical protein